MCEFYQLTMVSFEVVNVEVGVVDERISLLSKIMNVTEVWKARATPVQVQVHKQPDKQT